MSTCPRAIHSMRGNLVLGLASEMPKYSARRAFLWQLIAKNRKRRLALHTTAVHPSTSSFSANTEHLLQIGNSHLKHNFIFSVHETRKTHFYHAVRCQQWLSIARHSRSRHCLCTAHARRGGGGGGGVNSVWQMGESVFLWRLRSPSHLNQLFCNLHDLWIEFSACLERRLLKRRTTVALSDLASRTYAGVEPINLSPT